MFGRPNICKRGREGQRKEKDQLSTKQSNLTKTHPQKGHGVDLECVHRQPATCDTATRACIGDSDENGHSPEDDWTPGAMGSYNNRLECVGRSCDGGGGGDKQIKKQQVDAQRAGSSGGSLGGASRKDSGGGGWLKDGGTDVLVG